jgi:division protein CdvB (Snf7/Vps24/ESCRT-III family)
MNGNVPTIPQLMVTIANLTAKNKELESQLEAANSKIQQLESELQNQILEPKTNNDEKKAAPENPRAKRAGVTQQRYL